MSDRVTTTTSEDPVPAVAVPEGQPSPDAPARAEAPSFPEPAATPPLGPSSPPADGPSSPALSPSEVEGRGPAPLFVSNLNLTPKPYWNSYVAGAALGLVLLAAFFFTGRGLGASGAMTRMAAYGLDKVETSVRGGTRAELSTIARRNTYTGQYLKGPADPLDDFLVYMFVGVLVGGFVSGFAARRMKFDVSHGPRTTIGRRLFFATLGGVVSAFGARLARGCTSGQALTGGATLAVGSWVFMLAVFAGAYALAYFMRKEWT